MGDLYVEEADLLEDESFEQMLSAIEEIEQKDQ